MSAPTTGRLLIEHRFGYLPVVDDTGCLIKIGTKGDFVKLAIDALDADEAGNVTTAGR